MSSDPQEAYESMVSDFEAVGEEKRRQLWTTNERLLVRMDELGQVADNMTGQIAGAQSGLEQIRAQLKELERIRSLVAAVGAHVHTVDAQVTLLEAQVADSTREYNKRSLKQTLSPIGRLFGVQGAPEPMPPLARPLPHLDSDQAMLRIRTREEKEAESTN